ncbi:hypothetical protein ANCDUO_21848 [Ancylostoma duodenale]|uniref:Uncharacterized protein n=1 Tax=Ancylostoma duodenale TaxID=51022 RepID=A0A0C2FT47_9BILA|nr:hypothetical protein ANCDUO_21848 [Ancylostoma duodenale]
MRTMHRLQASLRAAWTQFDLSLMRLGVLSFVETLLFTISSRPLSAAQSVVARALSWPVHAFITFYHLVQLVPQTEMMQRRLHVMGIGLALDHLFPLKDHLLIKKRDENWSPREIRGKIHPSGRFE